MNPDDLPQWDPYEASIENFERAQEERNRQIMKTNKRHRRWEDHMGKLWQFADMIIQDIRTFYGVYQKEYDDKVVNATLDKLEIDLEAIVKEYYKASEIVQIIPQVDLPASFVRVEEHPTMGEGWYTAKFTCPGCQKEMTVLGNCAASCECSIWRVDIKSNRALRIDRSPLGLV